MRHLFSLKTSLMVTGLAGFLSLAAASAHAASFTGSFAFSELGAGGADGATSLTLNSVNFDSGIGVGSFANELFSTITASTATLPGLSSTATSENVPDFLMFASAPQSAFDGAPYDTIPGFGTGNGNIYDFQLMSLTETNYNASLQTADYYGTGLLSDTSGTLSDTPATFTIGFSSVNNYSGTLAASPVPEPASLLMLGVGAMGLLSRRRQCAATE